MPALPQPSEVTPPSPETLAAAEYYKRVQASYIGQGMLRTDGGGADTPFGARTLAENFARIVFFDEFADRGGRLVPVSTQNRLHRWQMPVRLAVEFGPSVTTEQRARDTAHIASYLDRLSRLTGLPMRISPDNANHTVLIQNSGDKPFAARRIQEIAPSVSLAVLLSVAEMEADTYCTVFAFTPGRSATYNRAITVIRAELPERMRQSCIQEELAQSLGLVNDSPKARPSIFNDNQEFAFLTKQDELMLRMLYDARLKPGMSLREAWPTIETMAQELVGGDS